VHRRHLTAVRPRRAGAGRWAVAVLLLLAGATRTALAQRTDVVVLRNGDRITGEVMGMSRGMLDYKTDDVGRLSIEWDKVAQLTSERRFEVTLSSGEKYYGRFTAPAVDGTVVVDGARQDTLYVVRVAVIAPFGAGILARSRAYLDVGFTFAKANRATTLSASGEVDYRGPRFGAKVGYEGYAQGQDSVQATTRNTGFLQGARFLPNRWSVLLLTRVEQNDELGLDLRLSAGGASARTLANSLHHAVAVAAGAVVTRERFEAAEGSVDSVGATVNNLEALLSGTWQAFRYDRPRLDVQTTLQVYPSLSDLGRLRGEFAVRVTYELLRNFNVGLRFTDNFDTSPPEAGASTNDFVTSLTIGWTYRR